MLAESDGSVSASEAFEEIRDEVPRWERSRQANWEQEWQDRVAALLAWAEAFGIVTSVDGGYVLASEQDVNREPGWDGAGR